MVIPRQGIMKELIVTLCYHGVSRAGTDPSSRDHPGAGEGAVPALTANPDIAYLDSAATSQKPRQVIDAVAAALTVQTANAGRGGYPWSSRGARRIAEVRERPGAAMRRHQGQHGVPNRPPARLGEHPG